MKYRLNQDLFDLKKGEVVEDGSTNVFDTLMNPSSEPTCIQVGNTRLTKVELDIYTRLGVLQPVDENGRWVPEIGDDYWYLDARGNAHTSSWAGGFDDKWLRATNNVFPSRGDANAYRDEKLRELEK